jgi:flagellar basal-body rod modification protein FlgD
VAQRDYGQQALAATYIGKSVLGVGTEMVKAGDKVNFGYNLAEGATEVDLGVYDSTGKLVQTIKGDTTAGNHLLAWDGKDDNGDAVADGTYTVKVAAYDKDGNAVKAVGLTYSTVVSSLTSGSATSVLLSDGRQLAMDEILAVENPAATASAQ